jgi:nicotinate-nucleotide--dimethylbenzimidazole phosphoribosyltransferase
VSVPDQLVRPPTPGGFDASRAAERAAGPGGWRYGDDARAAVHRVIAERRDIRRLRPEEIPPDVLGRVLEAAHRAPPVGLMQSWRRIVVSKLETRVAIRRLAQRERLRQARRFDARVRQFLDHKVEGVVEAPLGICVRGDHGDPAVEILGRGTIPATDVYGTACAIENLWLAARAEGLGVGWVSYYRTDDLRALLGIPARVDPIAYLCVGWPDERPLRPGRAATPPAEPSTGRATTPPAEPPAHRATTPPAEPPDHRAATPGRHARRSVEGPDRAATIAGGGVDCLVLGEIGKPPLDLRLRPGEASGALLALPIVEAAGALHRDTATIAEAGVDRAPAPAEHP